MSQNGFGESGGGGADLLVAAKAQNALESLVQGKFSKPFTLSNGKRLRADLKVGWVHEWTPTETSITEAFAAPGGSAFTVAGTASARDLAVVGAGLAYDASRQLSYFGRLQSTAGQHEFDNAVTAGFRFVW